MNRKWLIKKLKLSRKHKEQYNSNYYNKVKKLTKEIEGLCEFKEGDFALVVGQKVYKDTIVCVEGLTLWGDDIKYSCRIFEKKNHVLKETCVRSDFEERNLVLIEL